MSADHPYIVGQAYIIRTVTMYYTGRLERVFSGELVLSEAAWIADTGRWSEALSTGRLAEVEPYPGQCIVSRAAIVDVAPWPHPLPRDVQAHARVSGGYAYLGVAVQPDQEGWQGGQWSGSGAIPAAGDEVTVKINRIGPAVVLRRVLVHGYIGLLVLPLNPPDWYRSQNGAHAPCTVFGAEIA